MNRQWLSLVVASVLVVGCSYSYEDGYEQAGGPPIAQAIRDAKWPTVESVNYNRGDILDAATIDVFLDREATATDAHNLVCDVVKPAIDAGDPPEGLSVVIQGSFGSLVDGSVTCR